MKPQPFQSLIRLLRRFGGFPLLAGVVAFALLRTVRDLCCAVTVADTTNAVLGGRDVWQSIGLMMIAMFANVPIMAADNYFTGRYRAHVQRAGMQELGEKLSRLPLSRLSGRRTGDVLSTCTNDLDRFVDFARWSGPTLIRQVAYVAGALAYSLSQNVRMTLIVFPITILIVPLLTRLAKPLERLTTRQRASAADSLADAQEILADPEFVKSYSLEDAMERRIGKALERQQRAEQKGALVLGLSHGIGLLGSYLPGLAAAGTGIFFLLRGEITAGFLVSFVQLAVQRFSSMIPQFTRVITRTAQAAASAVRLCGVLEEAQESAGGQTAVPPGAGEVPAFEARDVRFAYGEGPAVLDGVTLRVERGETVALVGSSGGGKSTLVGLLMGVYTPQSGEVLCMGRPVGEWNPAALRQYMAPVFQESFLFPATVRENLCGEGGDEARCRAALENAGLLDWVEGLPRGLDTVIAERGDSLSGGQRQRMTIARAFYKDAPILLLDEPTSALDTVTEDQFQQVYRRLRRGRTTLVVAHRLKTIRDADRICVLEGGRIVQEGRHEELIAREGAYRRLYEAQAAADAREGVSA